jgi:hypothetical protein
MSEISRAAADSSQSVGSEISGIVARAQLETDHQPLTGCRKDALRSGAWRVRRRAIVLDAMAHLDRAYAYSFKRVLNPTAMTGHAPLRSFFSTTGGGRSQISVAPPSPQSGNLRVGPQLPFHIVTAGPKDDAGGAAGLDPGETLAQLLASACEGHLFGGGYVDERVMAVRNVEVMTAVDGEVADFFVRTFDAGQPRFAVRQRFQAFRIGRVPVVIGERARSAV